MFYKSLLNFYAYVIFMKSMKCYIIAIFLIFLEKIESDAKEFSRQCDFVM